MLWSRLKIVIPETHGRCVFIRENGEVHNEQNCLHASANSYQLLPPFSKSSRHISITCWGPDDGPNLSAWCFPHTRLPVIVVRCVTAWHPLSSQNRYWRLHLLSAMSSRKKRVIAGLKLLFLFFFIWWKGKIGISDPFWSSYYKRNRVSRNVWAISALLKKSKKCDLKPL